jgi:hypothetical protein
MEDTMLNSTIEYEITSHAAPLQVEGIIRSNEGEIRPFYFCNRNNSLYCIVGSRYKEDYLNDSSMTRRTLINGMMIYLLDYDSDAFSLRQTLFVDEDDFYKEISLSEALEFIMMTHKLSL